MTENINYQTNENPSNFEMSAETIFQKQKEILEKYGHCEIYYILDDNEEYRKKLLSTLQSGLKETDSESDLTKTSIIAVYEKGESLIDIYQKINSQNIPKTNQFMFLDGALAGGIEFRDGYEVAQKIIEINEENKWQKPYVFGCSTTETAHTFTKYLFENYYLGEVTNKNLSSMVPLIKEHLTGPKN
jgi:hypothetical protein